MTPKLRVLVVDDDAIVRSSCKRILADKHDVRLAESGNEGLELLERGHFDLALVDLKLPDISGMDILSQAPDRFPDVPVVIITGFSTVKSAVEAVKAGAFDYLAKPFTPDDLEAAVEKGLRQRRLLKGYHDLRDALAGQQQVARILGESAAIKHVLSLVGQVAKTDATVLVTGESGTGKELVARAVHFASNRKDARFVAVDCGAIAPSLIASELFGHVRGAFTGATSRRTGLVETADEGTLFLDEVSNMPMDLQAMLLRAIETQEIRAVGASESIKVNVRYIVATNHDLRSMVAEGKFREDLFHRLNVFPIRLPPLRERREDIPLLARHFLAIFAAKMHKRIDDFTPEATGVLMQYNWPGNVRELSNAVERMVILCTGDRVGQAHLRDTLAVPALPPSVPLTATELNDLKKEARAQAASDIEKAFLSEALRRNDYNVTKAATQTGMQRPNFQALLKKHGLRIKDIIARER